MVSYEDNCIRITPAMVCEPATEYLDSPVKNPHKNVRQLNNGTPGTCLRSSFSYHDRACRDSASSLYPKTIFHPLDVDMFHHRSSGQFPLLPAVLTQRVCFQVTARTHAQKM